MEPFWWRNEPDCQGYKAAAGQRVGQTFCRLAESGLAAAGQQGQGHEQDWLL